MLSLSHCRHGRRRLSIVVAQAAAMVLALLWFASTAQASTGVLIQGDPEIKALGETRIAAWLASHGHQLDEKALGPVAIAALNECYMRNQIECAKDVFEKQGTGDVFVFLTFEMARVGKYRNIKAILWLLVRGKPSQVIERSCPRCGDEATQQLMDELAATVGVPEAAPVPAGSTPAAATGGTISVDSIPSGAAVEIDRVLVGRTPLRHEVPAGPHTITVELAGHHPVERKLDLVAGETASLDLTLRARDRRPISPSSWRRPLSYGLLAGSAVALVGGTVALLLDQDCPMGSTASHCAANKKTYRDTGTLGVAALVAGGVFGGGGAYLYFTSAPRSTSVETRNVRASSAVMIGWTSRF